MIEHAIPIIHFFRGVLLIASALMIVVYLYRSPPR